MPYGHGFFGEIHAVEPFDLGEQAKEHFAHGEVFFHFGFAERIFGLAQFFGGIGQIPGLRVFNGEGVAGEGLHSGKILFGEGLGAFGQIAQEVQHLRGRIGHFGGQRELGEVGVAQQLGFLQGDFQAAGDVVQWVE